MMIEHSELELFYQHLNSLYKALNNCDATNLEDDISFFNEHCQFDADEQHTLYMLFLQNNPVTNFQQYYKPENKELFDILFEKLEIIPFKDDVKLHFEFYIIELDNNREQFNILINNLLNHQYDNDKNFEYIRFNLQSLCLFFKEYELYNQVLNYSKEQ